MRGIQSVTADKDRILITSIEPKELSVSRFHDCLVFYRKGLQLPLRRQQGGRAEFQVDNTPFILRGLDEVSDDETGRPVHLLLVAKDLDRVKESAEAWGGTLLKGPEEREIPGGAARWATFRDPGGNELEVLQPL